MIEAVFMKEETVTASHFASFLEAVLGMEAVPMKEETVTPWNFASFLEAVLMKEDGRRLQRSSCFMPIVSSLSVLINAASSEFMESSDNPAHRLPP